MSDEPPALDPVLDLAPRIRRKRMTECKHRYCEIDDDINSFTCTECGNEIDPWFLRRQANEHAEDVEEWKARRAKLYAIEVDMCATINRLNAEVKSLTETKNRLWNEQINGKPLGAQTRRPRTPRQGATPR